MIIVLAYAILAIGLFVAFRYRPRRRLSTQRDGSAACQLESSVDMLDLDPSQFIPACVVRRNCVPAYRDATRYVSCKIEHFAETPDRHRYLHLNFIVNFGGPKITLSLTAQFGNPPQVGKAGTSIPAISLEFSGSDGALCTKEWATAVSHDYAIRFRALDRNNLDDLERCIAYMTEVPYFAVVEAEDGTVERFLVFDPAPDESVAAKFRTAFDALRREHPSGPAELPFMLSEIRPSIRRYEQSSIRSLARLLRCDPPEEPERFARIRWSRAKVLSNKVKLKQTPTGKDFAVSVLQIAPTEVGPETVFINFLAIPQGENQTFTYLLDRAIDPTHVRTEDDASATRRAWLYGDAGRFNTRPWNHDATEAANERIQPSEVSMPITLENCLWPMVAHPYTAVFETKNGTQWRCLILHDTPAPELMAEAQRAFADLRVRQESSPP